MPGKPNDNKQTVLLQISPGRVAFVLALIVLGLGIAHLAAHFSRTLYAYQDSLEDVYHFVHLGKESNLPTFVSTINLLGAGLLTLAIAAHERRQTNPFARHWWILGLALILMSIDELAMIHEGVIGNLLKNKFGAGEGIWYYSWVKLYIPLVLVFVLFYVRFLFRLPRKTALLFVVAGSGFVLSAIGVEMLEAYLNYSQLQGRIFTVTVEEMGEMMSIVLLVYALLAYMSDRRVSLRLAFIGLQRQAPHAPPAGETAD